MNKMASVLMVLQQRLAELIRKREKHPEYCLPKYNAAFTANAMSEDEDAVDEEGRYYLLRAPYWRSDEVRT